MHQQICEHGTCGMCRKGSHSQDSLHATVVTSPMHRRNKMNSPLSVLFTRLVHYLTNPLKQSKECCLSNRVAVRTTACLCRLFYVALCALYYKNTNITTTTTVVCLLCGLCTDCTHASPTLTHTLPFAQRATHWAPLTQAASRGIACQRVAESGGGHEGGSAGRSGFGAAAGLGAAAVAAAAACGIAVGEGGARGTVGCQEKERFGGGGSEGGGGGGGGPIHREDSRSAMWPNRDRPSECCGRVDPSTYSTYSYEYSSNSSSSTW